MNDFSFRVKFFRSPTDTINIDSSRWEWLVSGSLPSLCLCSHNLKESIKDSKVLVFKSEGWPSKEKAAQAAAQYVSAFKLTLARLRIGADFGNRAPKSVITQEGLSILERPSGQRFLNDVHGLMFYESKPQPCFLSWDGEVLRCVKQDHFEQVFSSAVDKCRTLSERELLALDLFNASFFQHSIDSRFILLVMAIEAILNPSIRSLKAVEHVESMISATQNSDSLSCDEKFSLLSSLKWLKYESINQTGRMLASSCLGERKYMDKIAATFFSYCYRLRSRLVHGEHPMPTQQEISSAGAQLEVFVSDLLSGNLRDIELV